MKQFNEVQNSIRFQGPRVHRVLVCWLKVCCHDLKISFLQTFVPGNAAKECQGHAHQDHNEFIDELPRASERGGPNRSDTQA